MKIICVGRNYVEHIEELNNEKPKEPIIFFKPTVSLNKSTDFSLPEFSNDIHHEIEIIFEIGKEGKMIELKNSLSYISKIGLGVDFTARDIQKKNKKKGLPWSFAKCFDNSASISKLMSINKFKDINNINFSLLKNKVKVQEGNSKLMIFNIEYLIHYISQKITLEKGDIIFTGTPKGVGKISNQDILEGYINDEKILNISIS